MVENIASLYAQKALNEKLFRESMISEDMYRLASEGIAIDIDKILLKHFSTEKKCNNRGRADGITKHPAVARQR